MALRTRYSFYIKATSLLLVGSICTQIVAPTLSYAITSGPSQAEYGGFTSGDTSEMVDLSTGDFKYDVPLMTVPGPDGGYPIVLSYNGGVGMHDEASWVGLGWSLNPGVVNRQMRGLPDDFSGDNGDNIKKTMHIRDNMNIGLSVSSDLMAMIPEQYGFDFSLIGSSVSFPVSYTMYYNTFKGLGSRVGIGAGLSALNNELGSVNATASMNLTIDSNEGSEVQGNLSAGTGFMEANTGFVYTARGGITSVNKGLTFNLPGLPKALYKAGGNYSTASHVPDVAVPMIGGSAALTIDVEAGAFGNHMNIPIRIEGSFAYMGVEKNTRNFKPYGYLYNHRRAHSNSENALMDYNRDNDVPINMKLPSLPVPVVTNDIYTVKGMGGGSVFRAFRNDAGIYYQPDAYNRSGGATVGLEVAAASGFKAAADVSGYYSSSYSGHWREDYDVLYTKFKTEGNEAPVNGKPRKNEVFHFRKLGEVTPMQNKALFDRYDGVSPSHIGITYANASQEDIDPASMPDYEGEYPFSGMQKFKTRIANEMNGKPIPLFERTERKKRNSLVEYRTAEEIRTGGADFFTSPNQLATKITEGTYSVSVSNFNFNASHIQNNHIAEFSILQTDGSRYCYGIPAYNMSQKEAMFSSTSSSVVGAGNDPTSGALGPYHANMLSPNLNDSRDKFISINEISPYAHAYLLTNILSDDYADLTGNGPSEDDYGAYTKFGYVKLSSNFRWRIPFTPVEYIGINAKGHLSVPYDNNTTYTTGTKELWYLQTVETKTHIAFFILSERRDGYQAKSEHGGRASGSEQKLMRLDKIILFSKKELAKPTPVALQTVTFEYSYDLCPGVPTNDPLVPAGYDHPLNSGTDANDKAGKLTLHKVTITREGSSKGTLTPYIFEYGTSSADNPAYHYGSTDRWGTYRPDDEGISGYRNDYNPYVVQDPNHKATLDEQAGAWNLKTIHTPSGSTIQVQYECDDYAYVQDKHAQQMMKIIGTGKVDGSNNVFADQTPRLPIRKEYRRLYFKPEKPLSGNPADINAAIAMYVNNLPDGRVYFKVNERLQIPKEITVSPTHVNDYVTGYTTVESYGYIERNGEIVPYIQIPEIDHKAKNPLRAAGLQYLRYKRADLSKTAPGGTQNVTEAVLGAIPMFFSSLELIFGFYNWAIMKGHCEFIHTDRPSFIRLCSPDGIKYGGGHRVKKITVTDGWNDLSTGTESTASYEQNFVYKTNRKGQYISSGVAAYEPIHGGDENAMKKPHLYDPDNRFIHNDKAFFIEDPLPETYYPAPQVGYSRVLVYTTATAAVPVSGSGISVHEYYTAKDFPTVSRQSQPTKTDDDQTTFIPFVAGIQFRNLGYSQAFSVEVNDMHGKPKAHYTFDSDNWNDQKGDVADAGAFLTYKKYVYNRTEPEGLSTPNPQPWTEKYPTLENDLPSTDEDALGLEFELFGELRETSDFSLSGGAQINGGVDPVPYSIFISAMPYFEYTETGVRTVTTNKIIYRSSVLSEIISYTEGNIERTRHIAYDKETGAPVLTITTSDYDDQNTDAYEKPTFSYSMPAHWYEKNMAGAYQNYRVEALLNTSGATATCHGSVTAADYFTPGDELYCPTCPAGSRRLWVTAVSGTNITLAKKDNSTPTLSGEQRFVVLRSGNRNLQDAEAGNIVSTRPPNGPGLSPLFEAYNAAAANVSTDWDEIVPFSFIDCFNSEVVHNGSIVTDDGVPMTGRIGFRFYSCLGSVFIYLDNNVLPANIRLYAGPTSNTVYVTNVSTGVTTLEELVFDNVEDCLINCMEGVLDASAVEYRHTHDFDLADLPTPSLNDYASGKKGVYRVCRTNAYFIARKQLSGSSSPMHQTFTGEDGTYEQFVKFDFAAGNENNIQKPVGWRWATQVPSTGFSRDGKILQTQNPLLMYTGNLYGYDHNLVTATAVNASHREIAFDGFEEHPLGAYSTAHDNGRIVFTTAGTITDDKAHSGKKAFKTSYSSPFYTFGMTVPIVSSINYASTSKQIQLLPNKKYVISLWFSHTDIERDPSVAINIGGNIYGADSRQSSLDGWRRLEAVFTTPASGNLSFLFFGNEAYIDDIRIHPFNSEMKTMVYDPVKYIPVAELDGRNYATFTVYDEEGKPVISKKETEKGIYTIGHTRSNINR